MNQISDHWSVNPVKDFILLVVYLLVPLVCNFTKRWTPCQIIYMVFDHKSRLLFCRAHFNGCLWLVNRTNLLGKRSISFASNGDWKKPFVNELHLPRDSHSLNGRKKKLWKQISKNKIKVSQVHKIYDYN